MAFDKKPLKYSDQSAIGSPEELDIYGVWVKSEPQDMTASMAEAVNFDTDATPWSSTETFETDFGANFGDLEDSNLGFEEFEQDIPEDSVAGAGFSSFDDFATDIGETPASYGAGGESSNELLMKLAGELSSIRAELNTLKKEFADIRAESGIRADTPSDDFYTGFSGADDEEDEKIALTGDEMEDFFASSGLSADEPLGFDALREADEAALKELANQNEIPLPDEEIEIDFDNLGIDLNNDVTTEEEQAEVEDGFPPLEDEPSLEDGFGDDLGTISFDETSSLETEALAEPEETEAFVEELAPLDSEDNEELKKLRLEGAEPHTPAPDNADYLEGDPFAIDDTSLGDTFPEETAVLEEDAASVEALDSEDIGAGDDVSVTEDISFGEGAADLSFDEVSFDLDDFSAEDTLSLEEETNEETVTETLTSIEEISEDMSLDAGSLDLSDAAVDEPEQADEIGEASTEETGLSDISFDDDLSIDMDDLGVSVAFDEPEESPAEDLAVSSAGDEILADEEPAADITEDSLVTEDSFDIDDFGEGTDLDLNDGGLSDDLAIDDFGESVELATKDDDVSLSADDDDSLAQVIPEGFEVNAPAAAISLDDDLEGFGDDLAIEGDEAGMAEAGAEAPPADTTGAAIPAGLKKDLKNVLSYMDHLLESLPEDKIEEFAKSEYFDTYKKIFKELGLV